MKKLMTYLRFFFLKIKYGDRLKIGKNVYFPSDLELVIDENSTITIQDGSIIKGLVELRATRNSKLTIASNCKIDKLVRIIATNGKDIFIGENSRIGLGTVFNGGESIKVGKNCLISGYVYLQTSMHNHKLSGNIIDNGYVYSAISIADGCWLGVHSVIFPGVHLSKNCVVGSNAVVNKSFSQNTIVGGIPAKELSNEV
jgi:acetyltransferase-like isoleucine patch superfamily enzyme